MAFHANAEAAQDLATVGTDSAVWEKCQIVGDTTTGGETDVIGRHWSGELRRRAATRRPG